MLRPPLFGSVPAFRGASLVATGLFESGVPVLRAWMAAWSRSRNPWHGVGQTWVSSVGFWMVPGGFLSLSGIPGPGPGVTDSGPVRPRWVQGFLVGVQVSFWGCQGRALRIQGNYACGHTPSYTVVAGPVMKTCPSSAYSIFSCPPGRSTVTCRQVFPFR